VTAPSQTLRVRITGTVTDLVRSCAEARAAIRSVSGEANRGRGPMGGLSDGLVRLGSVMRAVRTVATPALVGAAIPGVLGLAAALGQAAGAGLILPGALLGAISVFGALKIATTGFGEALSNIRDAEKFAEDIAKLTPAARGAALAVQALLVPYDALAARLQERLFAGLDTEITATGNVLLRVLAPAFETVAATANRTVRSILVELRSVRTQADFRSIGSNGATAFGNITAALRPLLRVFLDVAAVGASFLPQLTAGAGSAARRFSDMVARMRESGELAEIIQRGLDVLRQLGQLASNVGAILAGVFRASQAAGSGLIGTLVSITGSLREVVNSASGQTALTSFFTVLSTIASVAGTVLRALAPVLAVVLASLETGVTALAPSIGPLAVAFGAVVTALAPLLPLAAQVAVVVAGQLGAGLTTILPLLQLLVSVLQFLSPVLVPVVASLVSVKLAMLVLGPIFSLVSGGIGAITTAWRILSIAFVASPIGFVITLLALLVGGLIYAYQTSETFRNIVDGVFRYIGNAISSVIAFIGNTLTLLGEYFNNAGRSASIGFINGMNNVVAFAYGIPRQILGALSDLGRLLYNAGLEVIASFGRGIRANIAWVLSIATNALSAIRNLFPFSPARSGPFSGRGYTLFSGRALVTDMARGVRAAAPALQAAVAVTMGGAQAATVPTTSPTVRSASSGTPDLADLAALIGAELRAVFQNGIRADVDYQGLTLKVNSVNRSNARR
jgi:phage-related protein